MTLSRLAREAGVGLRGLLRTKEEGAKTLLASTADDAAILEAMIADPVLVERPIIETDKGARIGRPIETCSRFADGGPEGRFYRFQCRGFR